MPLTIHVYDTSSLGQQLADLTPLIHPSSGGGGLRFSTGRHGFASLECPFVPRTLVDSFAIYSWPGTPHVVVADKAASVVWEGRLEDISIVPGGVRLGAFGYWRALTDVPYTALWSATGSAGWREAIESTFSDDARVPAKYSVDTNNRLYIALKKNEIYANATEPGGVYFEIPHRGQRAFYSISFDYDITLPTNWICKLASYDTGGTGAVSELTVLTGDGANHTGSVNETTLTANKEMLSLTIYNNTGSAYTNTAESDAWFMKVTNIRVTTTATNILASKIATALVTYVNGVNSGQLSATSSILATTTDLKDEVYEDQLPADILDRLSLLHTYEAGVWEGQRLHFRAEGSAGRTFYVDVTRILSLERSIENIRNSAYAIYKDANGRALRTAVADNAASQARYSIIRRGTVNVQTTNATEAGVHRDVFLSDRADMAIRADIEFERLYDGNGAEFPLYALRAGDTLVMRNLPPTLSTAIDNIRSFLVGATEYDAVADSIKVTPKAGTPTLVRLLAAREAGIGSGFPGFVSSPIDPGLLFS